MTLNRPIKILTLSILVLLGLIITRVKPKRIAFGFYAGECAGNCGTIYEVTIKNLRLDTTSFWQTQNDLGNLQIKGQKLLEGNFNANKFSIPLIMLFEPRTIFGSPDGHDQGGYYLDFTLFGIKRYFEISEESQPFYFTNLTKSIDKKIIEANNELRKNGR